MKMRPLGGSNPVELVSSQDREETPEANAHRGHPSRGRCLQAKVGGLRVNQPPQNCEKINFLFD